VSSLQLPFDEVPENLASELRKMQIFNGNFYGVEEYAWKKSVISIQYQGDDAWAFWIRYKFTECSDVFCRDVCRKKYGLHHFVLKEDEPCVTPFIICSGLSSFGIVDIWDWNYEEDVTTLMTVVDVNEPNMGKLMFRTYRQTEVLCNGQTEHGVARYTNKLLVDSTSEGPRRLEHRMTLGGPLYPSGELPADLFECQVSAKDAFPGPVEGCDYYNHDDGLDGDGDGQDGD